MINRKPTTEQKSSQTQPGPVAGRQPRVETLFPPLDIFLSDAQQWLDQQDFLITSAYAAPKDSLGILAEANKLNAFDRNKPASPAVENLIARANRQYPNAQQDVQNHNNQQQEKTKANRQESTREVIVNAVKVAENDQEIANIVGATVGANSDVTQTAVASALSVAGKSDNTVTAMVVVAAATNNSKADAALIATTAIRAMPETDKKSSAAAIATSIAKIAGADSVAALIKAVINETGTDATGLVVGSVMKVLGTTGTAAIKKAIADSLQIAPEDLDGAVNDAQQEIDTIVDQVTKLPPPPEDPPPPEIPVVEDPQNQTKPQVGQVPVETTETTLPCRQDSVTGEKLDCSSSETPDGYSYTLPLTYNISKNPGSTQTYVYSAMTANPELIDTLLAAALKNNESLAGEIAAGAVLASVNDAIALAKSVASTYPDQVVAIAEAIAIAVPSVGYDVSEALQAIYSSVATDILAAVSGAYGL